MNGFQDIVENLKLSLCEHNKKTLFLCAVVLLMVFLAIFSFRSVKKSEELVKQNHEIEFDQELLIPKGPVVPDEYVLSRVTGNKWSSEEIQKWWTSPSNDEVQELSQANDRIVNGIVGAAP